MLFLTDIYKEKNVIPAKEKVFRAFDYVSPSEVKVIILGQDPYPSPKQASGLAFSTDDGSIPPSLANIYKELASDIVGFTTPKHGNLEAWAKRGVVLANTVLTTVAGKRLAHQHLGWQEVVARKLNQIMKVDQAIVIIAWGRYAQRFAQNEIRHNGNTYLISGAHPSPLSADEFFGQRYFSRANDFLKRNDREPVDWRL